jgi:hypothetical protein
MGTLVAGARRGGRPSSLVRQRQLVQPRGLSFWNAGARPAFVVSPHERDLRGSVFASHQVGPVTDAASATKAPWKRRSKPEPRMIVTEIFFPLPLLDQSMPATTNSPGRPQPSRLSHSPLVSYPRLADKSPDDRP